jgi:hypothetical protein
VKASHVVKILELDRVAAIVARAGICECDAIFEEMGDECER